MSQVLDAGLVLYTLSSSDPFLQAGSANSPASARLPPTRPRRFPNGMPPEHSGVAGRRASTNVRQGRAPPASTRELGATALALPPGDGS